jgi:Transglycosylase SLT domain
MSAPRRWARRAALALAGGGITAAGLGGTLPGGALGAEPGAGGSGEGSAPSVTTTNPAAPAPAPEGGGSGAGGSNTTSTASNGSSGGPGASSGGSTTSSGTSAGASDTPAGAGEAPGSAPAQNPPAPPAAPTVVVQRPQKVTSGRRNGASAGGGGAGGGAETGPSGKGSGGSGKGANGHGNGGPREGEPGTVPAGTPNGVAPAPLAAAGELNPTLPQTNLFVGSAVSAQALDFYRIPLFLLPVYQAAAFQYDVPWQVLAAINEVETNYGADQAVSTAGAVGWMQFMPATWVRYGVDATKAGYADPANPVDAIFAAARYLHAAGASRNIDAAIFAYNHSKEYVESVLLRARLIASFPESVIGTLTGLVDGRMPTAGAHLAVPSLSAGPPPSGTLSGAAGVSNATAGAVPAPAPSSAGAAGASVPAPASAGTAGTAPAPADAAKSATAGAAGTGGATGFTPPPPPRVAARRAEAAANAPAKPSQLVELLGVPRAPVVAVQDGRIVHLGHTKALGRYLVLRDIYGDVFTYAGLGAIAPTYRPAVPAVPAAPALQKSAAGSKDPAPTLPASSGRHRPVTLRVRVPAARALAEIQAATEPEGETAPAGMGRVRLYAHPDNPLARAAAARTAGSLAGAGSRRLKLRTGAVVSKGTVLGSLDTLPGANVGRLRFAVRPAGDNGTIDPRPLLVNWRELGTALHPKGSKGGSALVGATAGDALKMSKGELERAVLADPGIGLDACARRDVAGGAVDARVLAVLEFLSRSGLQPTVAAVRCPRGGVSKSGLVVAPGAEAAAAKAAHDSGVAVDISAVNGVPIAGRQGEGSVADVTIRTLLTLRGRFAPHAIVSLMKYPQAPSTQANASASNHIHIEFLPIPRSPRAYTARVAGAAGTGAAGTSGAGAAAASPAAATGELNAAQWSELIERIAALPKPTVAAGPSATAIPDPGAAPVDHGPAARGLAAGG